MPITKIAIASHTHSGRFPDPLDGHPTVPIPAAIRSLKENFLAATVLRDDASLKQFECHRSHHASRQDDARPLILARKLGPWRSVCFANWERRKMFWTRR